MEAMRNSKANVPAVVFVVMILPLSSFTESTVGSSPVQFVASSFTCPTLFALANRVSRVPDSYAESAAISPTMMSFTPANTEVTVSNFPMVVAIS